MYRILILIFINFLFLTNLHALITKDNMQSFVSSQKNIKKDKNLPVWEISNKEDVIESYIFESYSLAPVLGFSGGKLNFLVEINPKGEFLNINILEQDEPVFVSGLGVAPFVEFLDQYKGKFLSDSIKVANKPSVGKIVHIDGVSKATASVKIANDSILASSIKVAREKLSGVAPKTIISAKQDLFEELNWDQLIEKGLIAHLQIKNHEVEKLFKGSEYEDSSLQNNPNEIYLDLWVANLGIPSIARNLLQEETLQEVDGQIEPTQEAILIFANGTHQILSESFVPNTSPDSLEIRQDDYPINIHDGDYEIIFKDNIPNIEQAIILQVDKRFNFDPSSLWTLYTKVVRGDNSLYSTPEIRDLKLDITLPKKYFDFPEVKEELPIWLSSIYEQKTNLIILSSFLIFLFILLFKYKNILNNLRYKRTILLLFTLFFIGWFGQGQLSIVTVLGFIKAIINSDSLMFLLYDPFSLIIWGFVFLSLLIWGRGTFCGWLCPYGVLQELSYYFARLIKLPKIKVKDKLNNKLVFIKYFILLILIVTAIFIPNINEYLKEIEPFKTSITLIFDREVPYVLYALFWIILSMFVFKAFCRYFCPLGAFLSLLGRIKYLDWLPRRKECGNPCNNCFKNCNYNAIDKKSGAIKYADCFQCMDCVQIYSDDKLCKILIQNAKDKNITSWRKIND